VSPFLLLLVAEIGLSPADPRLGDLVRVEVEADGERAADAGHVEGFGCRWALQPEPDGQGWRGAIGTPADTSTGAHRLRVRLPDRVEQTVTLTLRPRDVAVTRLRVDPSFTRKTRPPALEARLERERASIRAMWGRPPSAPAPWGTVERPVEGRFTGRYGTQRRFNGEVKSVHYGLDLAGSVGTPVRAAWPGVVVLSEDRWAAGRTVILDHGAGVHTTYFHLSKRAVEAGDVVDAGQVLGAVGKSGRVTGPHLHWGLAVRCQPLDGGDPRGMYVDPEPLLAR
jgi:murein DD-endopeptidase MepM/ murein hydrolase activator NlpD